MTTYDQISSNKRKTLLIMTVFVLFFGLLGFVFGEYYGHATAGIPFMFIALSISTTSAITSFYFSDRMVLSISKARKVGRESAPQVYGILENLCIGSGIKKIPDLYIIEDSAPNAFATGRDPDHAVVAITSGLIDKLEKREIEGVLAHELSHIKNYDIRLMTIVAVLVGSVTLATNLFIRGGMRSRGGQRSGNSLIIIIGFALIILSPIIARLIKFSVSRSREYLADASATLLTRDPEGLATALQKISQDKDPLEVANEATAHLFIANPLKKGKNAGKFANLFNTHPPIEERIKRLRAM